ncbi:MAG: DUF3310 domain-containing protein [Undibacterium umbellatum]|uniref:DUF3310 domain-containing protein n=1 Tax=Undibacterium umbellatum TaxID=2762300 RepID=UPI003BB7BCD5
MNNYLEKILALVAKKPDLRAVQISDQLDIDLDIVENTLAQGVKAGNLIATPGIAPNNLPANTYRANPAVLGWVSRKESQPETTTDAPVVQVVNTKLKTKIEKAIAFMTGKKGVTANELAVAMELAHDKCSPRPYLAKVLNDGTVVKRGSWYCLATEVEDLPTTEQVQQVEAAATVKVIETSQSDPVHAPQHYTSGGLEFIDILRAKLTPDEYQGFLKGNVLKYVIRGGLKNGTQDYEKAAVYAKWLVEAGSNQHA